MCKLSQLTAGITRLPEANTNLRTKFQDFFRTWDTKKSAPIFVPFRASTYEFDSKTRHRETKNAMPMEYFFGWLRGPVV